MTRALSFRGDAIITTITTDIAGGDNTIPIAASDGWPSGSGAKPFVAFILSADLANHEKVLVASRTGLSLAVAVRGWDDTIASSFQSGATIMHVPDAASMQAFSDHLDDPDPAGHTSLLNAARHDLAARHTFGAALTRPSSMAPIGTAGVVGASATVADGAHSHGLDPSIAGPGLVLFGGLLALVYDDATVTVSGDTLQVKAGGIGNGQLGSHAVQAGNIDPTTVWPGTLADGSVDVASRIVDGIVTRAKLASDAQKSVDVAWGFLTSGTSTTDHNTVTTEQNIAGMTVTFTAVANRRYRTTVLMPRIQQITGGGETQAYLTDGSNTHINAVSWAHWLDPNDVASVYFSQVESGLGAGSTTRKLRMLSTQANLKVLGSAYPGAIVVEDIGPS